MIEKLFEKYGLMVLGGAIGAIIHRLRNKMSWRKFIASVLISMFVALCAGISCRYYLNLNDEVIYVICGVSGVFSEAILDELEEVIHSISGIIKSRYSKNNEYEADEEL